MKSKLLAASIAGLTVSLVLGSGSSLIAQIPSASQLRSDAPSLPKSEEIRGMEAVLQKRGTVSFRDTPISEVVYTLSQQWGVNIIAGSDVAGTVSGSFRDAPLREILDSLLSVNGYGYRQNGSSLLVLKQEQVGLNNPNFRAETLLLPQNLSSENLQDLMGALKVFSSPMGGQLQAIPANNTILAFDTPDRIGQMREMLERLTGVPSSAARNLPNLPGRSVQTPLQPQLSAMSRLEDEIVTLRPQFITATELAKGVQLALGVSANFVSIEGEQAIMVVGTPEEVRRANFVLAQLDRPRAQVRITAYIYDVAIGEGEQSGVDWSTRVMSQGLDSNGIPRDVFRNDSGLLTRVQPTGIVGNAAVVGGAATGTTAGAAVATGPTGPQWVFRSLSNNFELNTVIQALDETKGAKLLADPHVTVLDRQKASIDIITKIPIQQLTQTQQGGSIGTTAFEEAGVKLTVVPRIAADNTIQLEVTPEVSTLTGFSGQGNPIIDARRATTTVRVENQHTLVIGGLRQKSIVETVRGIPGLMKLKYIGKLFRAHNTELKESELIVFLQPEIVDHFTTGLPREEEALLQEKLILSRIQASCLGPHTPNCGDPNCPHHCPRPRPHQAGYDDGLIYPQGAMVRPENGAVSNFNSLPQVDGSIPVDVSSRPSMPPLPVQQEGTIYPAEVLKMK